MNTQKSPPIDDLTDAWKKNSDVIRKYLELQPSYLQLASEVAYTLEKILKNQSIKYAAVTFREKRVESFIEKISRKKYSSPLSEITDIAGVRLVYLYTSNFADIEQVINENFVVVEKVDKLAEQGDQKFGYGAVHYLVKLGKKSRGPRYDDLKGLICEIQVRTVLQDAWSIINHHLIYKKEKDIPHYIKRKINSLSGLFETADDQFDRIKHEREAYLKNVEENLKQKGANLDDEINFDNVIAYLEWKFPDLVVSGTDGHASFVLDDLNYDKYKTIGDLDDLITRSKEAREALRKEQDDKEIYGLGELAISIALDDPTYRDDGWDEEDIELFEQFEHLVKKSNRVAGGF